MREEQQTGWVQTTLPQAYQLTITDGDIFTGIDFGNLQTESGEIRGTKFNDLDGNGIRGVGNSGEVLDPDPNLLLGEPFADTYTAFNLGSIPGVPTSYGGLTLKYDDPNTLLIGGSANTASGQLYAIEVKRGAGDHIVGFEGTAAVFSAAEFNDGGVVYGPDNILFSARWPVNELGQLKPGSTVTDKVIDLDPLGVSPSPGGLAFVPEGFPGEDQLKLVSWSGGQFYTVDISEDGTGTYNVDSATLETQIVGGPEGIAYVPLESPLFDVPTVLIAEWSAGSIAVYEIDSNGDPITSTRQTFLSNLSGAEGAFIDPLTGDFLFSTFGGGDRVVAIQGFAAPEPTEPGLQDWIIYIDDNNNGQRDENERFTLTDINGNYKFTNLAPGTYTLREEQQPGWVQTTLPEAYELTITDGDILTGIDFGNVEDISDQNQSPEFTSTPQNIAIAGELFRYDAIAFDPNSDRLTYDLPVKPEGMTVDATTGTVVWQPNLEQVGTHDVILRVKDSQGGVNIQSFQVQVDAENTAPVITSNPPEQAVAGLPYQYRVRAQDAEGDNLTFSLNNPPAGVSIDENTGVLNFLPTAIGTQDISITVSDDRGGSTIQTYTLNVVDTAVNDAPTISSTPRKAIALGSRYLYQIAATDPNGDPISYNLDTAPAGMTIDEEGLIEWQPTSEQFGSNSVVIRVEDGRGGSVLQEFTINVTSQVSNLAPNITSNPNFTTHLDQNYQYNPEASDPEGDLLIWSLNAAPQGMSLDGNTGQIRWNPTAEQIGIHQVEIAVTDALGGFAIQSFT